MKRVAWIALLTLVPMLSGCCGFHHCRCEKKDPYPAAYAPAPVAQPACGTCR